MTSPSPKPKGLFALDLPAYDKIYGAPERQEIYRLVDIFAPVQTAGMLQEDSSILREAELIFSGWGAPVFTAELLAAAPNLKAVFYGAGSVHYFVSEAFWDHGVLLSSAWGANAVPVSEYALAQTLLGLKCTWQNARLVRQEKTFTRIQERIPGVFGSTVGLVSLGMIGKRMVELLKPFDVQIIAYDPYLPTYPGVTLVPLDEVFRQADVVSVHTPWLKETEGLITGAHLASMKPYSTFINTSRGAVICEAEMIAVLQQRPDLNAVIDVTHPEPPPPDSPLYTLPNVILTPHIAGSVDAECRRQGQYMIAELKRYLSGEPLVYGLTQERVKIMA
jgi:phosphoglycerate dehydrogenase-like enzyme